MKSRDKFQLISDTYIEESENNPPKISGFAIHPGKFNQVVEIPEGELENIANSLKGSKLMIDHSYSVRDIIGKVNDAFTSFDKMAGKEAVKYYAETDDEEVLEKMSKGYIDSCSIGFKHDSICSKCGEDFHECEHWFDEAHVICENCDVFELSIVTHGADGEATAGVAGLSKQTISNFKKQFEDKLETQQDDNKIEGGNVMESNEGQPVDVSELVSAIKKAESASIEKDNEISTLKEKLEDLETFKKDIQEQIDSDKSKTTSEKEDLTDELNEKTKALDDLSAKVRLQEATELAEREVVVGLIKEAEKEEEIERLSKDQSIIDITTPIVEKLEAQKKEKGSKKVPESSDFKRTSDKKYDLSKLSLEEKDVDPFMQGLVHTVFKYDRVHKGENYMGFKDNNV
jgi:phage head maturation protease